MVSEAIKIRIRIHFENFLNSRIKTIESLAASDLEINPFLIASIKSQLKIDSTHNLAEWLVRQRIERGTVTGFGNTLQKIAKEFSNEKPLSGLTMKIIKEGKTYNLMIKSGPNPYPMQPAIDMQRILLETKNIEPNSIPIFCMCYGNEASVSNIVKSYMSEVKRLVGKDFWEFISGDPKCQREILTIAKMVGKDYKDKKGNSLNDVMCRKITYVEDELTKLYGKDKEIFWKNVLEDVY